jgi:hypothetical protein
VVVTSTVEEALAFAEEIGNKHGGVEILITGSLHLVGSSMSSARVVVLPNLSVIGSRRAVDPGRVCHWNQR